MSVDEPFDCAWSTDGLGDLDGAVVCACVVSFVVSVRWMRLCLSWIVRLVFFICVRCCVLLDRMLLLLSLFVRCRFSGRTMVGRLLVYVVSVRLCRFG